MKNVLYDFKAALLAGDDSIVRFKGKFAIAVQNVPHPEQPSKVTRVHIYLLIDERLKVLRKEVYPVEVVHSVTKKLWNIFFDTGNPLAPLDGLNCPVYSASRLAPLAWKLLVEHYQAKRVWFFSLQDRDEIPLPQLSQ